MKKVLIILVSLLILGGAITGSMKFLELGPFAPKTVEVIKVVKEELKSISIDMEPILIPIFKVNRPVAKIQIQIKLVTRSPEKAIKIQRMMPRISDTFVIDLHAFMPRLLKEKDRIDVFILKQRLKLMSDRNFGKGLIDDVLVQSVIDTSN